MADQPVTPPPKRRNWFARHPKTTILLAFILLIAIGLFAFDTIAKRRLAARIDAIRAKGEPVCVEDLKKLVRPGPNSLPDVLAIAPGATSIKLGDKDRLIPYLGNAPRIPTGCRLPNEQVVASRWFLNQLKEQLSMMHAAMRSGPGTVRTESCDREKGELPRDLMDLRIVSRLNLLEIASELEGEMPHRAAQLLLENQYFLNVIQCDAVFIDMLVQQAIHDSYLDSIERVLNRGKLTASDVAELQRVITSLEFRPSLKASLLAERTIAFSEAKRLLASYQDDPGKWNTKPAPSSFGTRLPGIAALDADACIATMTELIDSIEPPDSGLRQRVDRWSAKAMSLPGYCVVTKVPIPGYARGVEISIRIIGTKRAMLVALAAERFRLDHQRWPTTANELVPTYLAAIPLDPIDDQPIRYAIIPEGIKTWTISGNGGDEDNGGDVRRLESATSGSYGKDSGWVLLNPNLRGRACDPPSATTAPSTINQRRQ